MLSRIFRLGGNVRWAKAEESWSQALLRGKGF
jgi:hypothetical protein